MRPRSGTVALSGLKFPDAAAPSARAQIAAKLNALIATQGLTQTEAAGRLHMPQSKISAIHNYKLRGISLERLLDALVRLNQHVEISIRQPSQRQHARIEVSS